MTSDSGEDVLLRLNSSQIISAQVEAGGVGGVGVRGGVGGVGVVGGSSAPAAVELGRRLLVAARRGDSAAVLELLGRGAPFAADWLGTSPLHLAALHGHAEACAVLVRSGVSRDLRTKVERTPLHLAAFAGRAHVARLLLEHGAQADARDMLRMTPLHWAAQRGHLAVAAALLRHGADPLAASKFDKTPLQLAQPHPQLRQIIEDAIKEREAQRSVDALVSEHMTDASTTDQNMQNFEEMVQRLKETKGTIKVKEEHENTTKAEVNTQGAGEGEGEGAGARLLRRHGIALLPEDEPEGATLLSALHSGRTIVLSDAGKLMLKESEIPQGGGAVKRGGGMVLRATPVHSPPKPGVKVFTLNNKCIALPHSPNSPHSSHAPTHNVGDMQVKFFRLTSDSKLVPTGNPGVGTSAAAGGDTIKVNRLQGNPRPVKIIVHKTDFNRLIAANAALEQNDIEVSPTLPSSTTEPKTIEEEVEEILRVPEEALLRCSVKYLRSHVAAARKALGSLRDELGQCKAELGQCKAELGQCKARLAHYEP